jgi:hypothetical protein
MLLPGVRVEGFLTAFLGSLLYAIIDTFLTSLFNVDQGETYYGLRGSQAAVASSSRSAPGRSARALHAWPGRTSTPSHVRMA